MSIDSLPPALQPLIQENYLDRFFKDSLHSKDYGDSAVIDSDTPAS